MYDPVTNGFLLDSVLSDIKKNPAKGSMILLQCCAQNPTGIDPTEKEWEAISRACKDHQLIPLVDSAYLGFVTSDFKKDSYPLRLLLEDGHEFFFCQSFSKNMAIYGERLGALQVVCKDKAKAKRVQNYFAYYS